MSKFKSLYTLKKGAFHTVKVNSPLFVQKSWKKISRKCTVIDHAFLFKGILQFIKISKKCTAVFIIVKYPMLLIC